jgi:small subunit ribosomal protein S13
LARIAGIDIPRDKRVEIALTYIYGVGRSRGLQVLRQCGVDRNTKVRDLTEAEIASLRETLEQGYTLEGDLRREVVGNVKRLMEIGCYRGLRHRRGLPVRGQRTKTNARTRRGNKKAVGIRTKRSLKH